MRLVILGARVIDPSVGLSSPADVIISGGCIERVLSPDDSGTRPVAGDRLLDASGCIVMPGLTDLHVHLREPGMEDAEDVASGTRAAAAGGFTSIVCQPNTRPVLDNPDSLRRLLEVIARNASVRVVPAVALSLGLRGGRLSKVAELARLGAGALSDDGRGTRDVRLLGRALVAADEAGLPVMVHCEDHALSRNGVMTAGAIARSLGLPGIPAAAERLATERALRALRRYGGRLHVQHVSTRGALNAIRRAKAMGLPVTCEATPHHLFLGSADVGLSAGADGPDPNLKMNPPLRSARDVAALRQGLADGSIDAVATDHAPHTREAKGRGFMKAPFGVIGLETALALVLRLVEEGVIDLGRAVELLSLTPARILGGGRGNLGPGAPADVTVVDPDASFEVSKASTVSRSANTPFTGWKLRGKVKWTIVGGRVVYES
jgi:dihydroorotase